jgi:lysine-specific demethylase 3
MAKDTLERATEPNFNLKQYLKDAYLHPVFKEEEGEGEHSNEWVEDPPLVPVIKHPPTGSTPVDGEKRRLKSLSMERLIEDYD